MKPKDPFVSKSRRPCWVPVAILAAAAVALWCGEVAHSQEVGKWLFANGYRKTVYVGGFAGGRQVKFSDFHPEIPLGPERNHPRYGQTPGELVEGSVAGGESCGFAEILEGDPNGSLVGCILKGMGFTKGTAQDAADLNYVAAGQTTACSALGLMFGCLTVAPLPPQPPAPVCGDGKCETGESCPVDCKPPEPPVVTPPAPSPEPLKLCGKILAAGSPDQSFKIGIADCPATFDLPTPGVVVIGECDAPPPDCPPLPTPRQCPPRTDPAPSPVCDCKSCCPETTCAPVPVTGPVPPALLAFAKTLPAFVDGRTPQAKRRKAKADALLAWLLTAECKAVQP